MKSKAKLGRYAAVGTVTANGLPAPPGAFNITIRNCWPQEDALNPTYRNPPIKKVQG